MENFVVYLHINPLNGKKYVGTTSTNVEKRWRKGKGYKERNPLFYADIVEIGWENFIHLILYEELTEERAKFVETELIYLWDSVENGYNQSYGDGCKGMKGKKGNGEKMKGNTNAKGKGNKKVICITTNKIFNSIEEGAEFYNIKGSNHIGECCKGKYKTCGKLANGVKLEWKYLSDYLIENDN